MSGEELRKLAEAATPGPWEVYSTIDGEDFVVEAGRGLFRTVATPARRVDYGRTNAAFIAAADPAAVLALLDRLEAAERRAEMWQGLAERAKAQLLKSPKQVAEEETDALRKQLGCDCGGVTFHKNCASRQYVITKREFDESKARAEAAEAAVGRVRGLADEWVKRDCEWSCESEMLDDLRAALKGPR